ncbi:MAG: hypothetical protein ACYDD1_00740 [Caulobacteraceae bacterium]
MFDKLKAIFKDKAPDGLKLTPTPANTLAPVVVIACGAGMAFWWWSQWARSREEARVAEAKAEAEAAADLPHGEVTEILDPEAMHALDESLAVQADADHAKVTNRGKPPAAA